MKRAKLVCLSALLLSTTLAAGQQTVPFDKSFNIPVAPKGLAGRPLPKLPMEFDTAEGQRIRVSAVTTGLEYPFSIAFLPNGGGMLVTERAGRLRLIHDGALAPQPVAGVPASFWAGESGMPGAIHGYM